MTTMKRLALLVLLAGTAQADDRTRAESYFRAGEKAYGAQNFAAAAEDFEIAYEALPLPEIAFSAAQAYRRQYQIDRKPQRVVRAVALFRAYLDKVSTGGRVADAADALAEMQHELDALIKQGVKVAPELAAEHTQLGVNVSLGGAVVTGMHEVEDRAPDAGSATVKLDGAPAAPFELINVTPGKHTFHVEAPGFFPRDEAAVATAGTAQMIDVTLQPKPGRIAVTTTPGAHIDVDGRPAGSAPRGAIEAPAGRHLVAIGLRGHVPIAREIRVGNDQQVALDEPLALSQRRRAVPWILGGAGVLALASVTTGTVAYLSQRDAQDLETRAHGPGNLSAADKAAYSDDRDRRDAFATTAWITGGAAVATAAAALLLYRFDDPAPVVMPTGAGMEISGRF